MKYWIICSVICWFIEDSDYDDEFIVDADKTNEQLKTAEELIELVDKYIDEN